MGMVKIGGRDLRVLDRRAEGSFAVDLELAKARKTLKLAADDEESFRALAGIVLCYVANNDPPVALDWLISVLPSEVGEVIRECVRASGREAATTPGEAPRP